MKPFPGISTIHDLTSLPITRANLFLVILAAPIATFATGVIYKSVDETGHVTYSTEPPANAVEAEAVHVPRGPSAETTEQAIERARETEQKAGAQFEAMTKRRQEAAQARREDERLRLDREAAERRRQLDDSRERLDRGRGYYPVYPPYWGGVYPPHRPIHPSYPVKPVHPIIRPHERSHSHINPPTRRWLRDRGRY